MKGETPSFCQVLTPSAGSPPPWVTSAATAVSGQADWKVTTLEKGEDVLLNTIFRERPKRRDRFGVELSVKRKQVWCNETLWASDSTALK